MHDATNATTPLSYIQSDRFCAECGQNLHGQPVFREQHYQMLIARCPQCERVEPVEAYPPLGRWTTRWSMLLTAMWLVGLIGFALGGLGIVSGMTIGFSGESTQRYERFIRSEFQTWLSDQDAGEWYQPENRNRFGEFWSVHGEDVRATAGPLPSLIDRTTLMAVLVPMTISFALGTVWSIALLHRRRGTLVRIFGLLMLVPASIYVIAWIIVYSIEIQSMEQVNFLDRIFPIVTIVALLNAGLFWGGLRSGRSVARGIVRGLLPPRRRGALGMLWTKDGLTMPQSTERAES